MNIWHAAKNYEGTLEVTRDGRVRTLDYLAPSKREKQSAQLRKGVELLPDMGASYPRITLKRNGVTKRIYVHRLVAETFVTGYFEGATVDHIDGCRANNDAANLRWLSRADNTRAQNADGRGVPKGERHPSAKLKNADVSKIKEFRDKGLSLAQVGAKLGVSGSLIHKIERGLRRCHDQAPLVNAASNTAA